MKKGYNPVSDVRNENSEGSRRLYRGITELSQSLDESRDRAQSCAELFLSNVEVQRVKLRDYCEKLIFADPQGHGRKGEELLWRKGYYDVVTTAKHLRKNNAWSQSEAAQIQGHLLAGVGHYHHIIFRLQIESKIDLRGIVDFPLLVNDGGLTKGKASSRMCPDGGSSEWAWQILHRSLICLGDLNRYFLDLNPLWDTGLPQRYYLQAVCVNADLGMPHNQLGTLAGSQNFNIDAAYHYMRCLTCTQSFEGAEGNLRRIFERNNKWLDSNNRWNIDDRSEDMPPSERIHRFIARFLVLVDVWFFDKTFPANPNQLCQQMVEDLRHCLLYTRRFPSDNHLSVEQLDLEELLRLEDGQDSDKPEYMKDELVFELIAMLLLCISRLKSKRSKLLPGLVTFTVALLSELVQQIVDHIQDSVLSIPLQVHSMSDDALSPLGDEASILPTTSNDSSTPETITSSPPLIFQEETNLLLPGSEGDKVQKTKVNGTCVPDKNGCKDGGDGKKKKKKLKYLNKFRRRRPKTAGLTHNSSEESDYSDGDLPYGSSCSSDEGNGDISENDERHNSSSDEEEEDEADDSDESSTSTQVESKVVLDKEGVNGGEKMANGVIGEGISPEKIQEGKLVNGKEELALTNGVCPENEKDYVPNDGAGTNSPLDASEGNGADKKTEVVVARRPADPADLIELVADEGLLQTVKVCSDWLLGEKDLLKLCARSLPIFYARLASLLNLILIDASVLEKSKENAKFFKLKDVGEIFHKVPLAEDVKLKGVSLFKEVHDLLDWEFCRNHCLHSKEEALLRVYKLVAFGKFVGSIDDGQIISYNEAQCVFTISSALSVAIEREAAMANGGGGSGSGSRSGTPAGGGGAGRREEVMQHMGQLWLRAQVREMETRVQQQRRRGGAPLSPYVTVDCDALTLHLALVKQLVAARRFIVLIPGVVVNALDTLKREVGRAREAIRWLEAQFQRGNRFLRGQRAHERLPLPLIKYPKKKDREAWFFFQVVECCYYFSQQNGVHELTPETSLVTLLTGQAAPLDDPGRAYSPLGVACSAGINLEHIEAFHAKWKTSSKSHG